MATVRYFIRTTKKNIPATIRVNLRHGKTISQYSTLPYEIAPADWNIKRQRIKLKSDDNGYDQINDDLSELEKTLLKKFNTERGSVYLPKDWLKKEIDSYFIKEQSLKHNLNSFVSAFIDDIENGRRLVREGIHRGQKYKYGTVKNFKGFYSQLMAYQQKRKRQLDFNDITIDFYDDFVAFFMDKGYSPNTIGRHVKNLKTIMRLAFEEGLHSNQEIERKRFKTFKVDVFNIYLTQEELTRIRELDLSEKPVLELARDVFLIGCYTAQRFSDYSQIKKENLVESDGSKLIVLSQKKTGEKVYIPVMPDLNRILSKYGYNVPKVYEQKLNKSIKVVGKLAGIDDDILVEEIRGGNKLSKVVPKYEMIKTHTARRSGCTNMYLGGVPTLDIMKISGHKTEREFLKYIKVTKEESAKSLVNHPYFIQNNLKIV